MSESFTAVVEFQIRPENNSMAEWLEVWAPRGEDALTGEPQTTAYGTAVNLEDELNVMIFERYADAAALDAHVQRPAHETLMKNLGERNMTKRRVLSSRFEDIPGYGFWGRDGGGGVLGDGVISFLGLRFGNNAQRDDFIKLSGEHAQYCHANEPGTLVYSGGLATADADREIDVKAGDLMFVMVCTDMAAVEQHRDDPNHIGLGPKIAEHGIEMTPTFRRSYQTTGHGFFWR